MTHPPSVLAARLTAFREAAGMTKQQLARKANVSDVSIGYWESGTIKQIGHERLMALADALNITVSELVDDPRLEQQQDDAIDAVRYRCLKDSATGGSIGIPDGWLDASDPESWDEIIDSLIQENTGDDHG